MTDRIATVAEQRESWDELSPGWQHWLGVFERGGAPITARLLELGGVRPGSVVLDVGTGLGEPAIPAARRAGPGGRVVGLDVSGEMLRAARERAAGLGTLTFLNRAVEELTLPPASFDVVLSRWCLMLLDDLAGALRAVHRLLVPGGVLTAAVWGTPADAPMAGLPVEILADRLGLTPPPPGQPGPHALADPDLCRTVLRDAGFTAVSVTRETAPFWLSSGAEYASFAADVRPPLVKRMLADWCTPAERAEIDAALARAADARRSADGRVALPSAVLCLRAVKAQ
ncbi:class I SAM-dependent methyltransferase [Symbioplanes lichenis]|uniref:class I SAM-dependent methyltransferase n=1 Tax=Symbioplanes lichenis TaxID=1629072 RepID=UPI0027389B27|nr:class I SAM-dependent methyltransferase [Actinoplanes lichenis]